MYPVLQKLCIGCAKFNADDPVAFPLAAICITPYFAVYHTAVYFYAKREIHVGFTFLGILANTGLGFVLKRALRHPRPRETCGPLGICHKFGMPSSHTQMMAFIATTACLLFIHRHHGSAPLHRHFPAGSIPGRQLAKRHPVARMLTVLELLTLISLAAAVGYARIHLGYHSLSQVLAGGAVGVAFGAVWHMLTVIWLRPWYSRIAGLACAAGVWLRDTLDCVDVNQAEAELFCSSGTVQGEKGKAA